MNERKGKSRRAFLKGAVLVGGAAAASRVLAACAPPTAAPAASAPPASATSGADNKALVRKAMEEVWNQGNLVAVDQLYHPHYGHYDPNFQQADDLAGLKEHVTYMRAVLAGLQMTVDDIIAEADKVGVRWTVKGTHQAEFMGVPATGLPVTLTGTSEYRIAGGKIAQTWQVWNLFGMLPQIGAMPASGMEVFDWGEPLGTVAGTTGTLEENKGVVQQAISRFWNGFHWEDFGEVYHPDYRNHEPGSPTRDFESTKSSAEALAVACPDLCVTIHDLVAEGDKVVKRWIGTYTSLGPYLGAAPTGKAGVMQGINIYRIAGGKVAEIWWAYDLVTMLRTIGLLPG